MKNFLEKYGQWGIVAGAAEGLGEAFSISLAKKGQNLVLIDKQEDKLWNLSNRLKLEFSIQVKEVTIDLSKLESLETIFNATNNLDCRLLIYNAAYGPVKPFLNNTEEELNYYVNLNSLMPLHLAHRFIKKNQFTTGGIILMSSLAGLYGTQLVAPYGSTKAFDYNLAEALYHEFMGTGMDILACCAGAIDTPAYRNTMPRYGFIKPSVMSPSLVVDKALNALGKKGLIIPGLSNQFTQFLFTHIFSRSYATKLMNQTMKNMYATVIDSGSHSK